jgi:uncharacterized membrane protein
MGRLKEKNIHLIFTTSLIFKGVFALFEILAGILAYFVTQQSLLNFVTAITQDELVEDPKDLVANFLLKTARHMSVGSQAFVAFYLLSHGVIKLFLIIGLLRGRLWYYPSSMVVFGLFVAYQLYRFTFTNSFWLMLITIIDVIVIWLTWHEYKYLLQTRS